MEQGISTLASAMIESTTTASISGSMIASAMIATWALVAVACFALGILVFVAIRSRTRRIELEDAVQAFRSLDIEAFRNLVDSAEETFLRNNLSPKKFREIKRQRAWAAFIYAREAGKAATALARVGQAAQRSSDPEVAASGVQVTDSAFRLRLQTISASLRLLAEVLLPDLQSRSVPPLVDQYERTAKTLFRLGRFSFVRSKSA